MIDIADNEYRSKRTIRYFEDDRFLGEVTIDGFFTKIAPKTFSAEVELSGFYNGPVDVKTPKGYVLPVREITDTQLEGSFVTNLETKEGRIIRAEHHHVYDFYNGVKRSLTPQKMDLKYNVDDFYYEYGENSGALRFSGNSTLYKLTESEFLEALAIYNRK